MNIQKMSKNKEVQADYKLRAFIIFLFVVIICVLKFAHVYYDRHVLQVSRGSEKYFLFPLPRSKSRLLQTILGGMRNISIRPRHDISLFVVHYYVHVILGI